MFVRMMVQRSSIVHVTRDIHLSAVCARLLTTVLLPTVDALTTAFSMAHLNRTALAMPVTLFQGILAHQPIIAILPTVDALMFVFMMVRLSLIVYATLATIFLLIHLTVTLLQLRLLQQLQQVLLTRAVSTYHWMSCLLFHLICSLEPQTGSLLNNLSPI